MLKGHSWALQSEESKFVMTTYRKRLARNKSSNTSVYLAEKKVLKLHLSVSLSEYLFPSAFPWSLILILQTHPTQKNNESLLNTHHVVLFYVMPLLQQKIFVKWRY